MEQVELEMFIFKFVQYLITINYDYYYTTTFQLTIIVEVKIIKIPLLYLVEVISQAC